jgi:Uncharacterized integral membrane protein
VFPIAIFAALAASRTLPLPAWLPRYDFLLLACLAMQWGMVAGGLETKDELKVIGVFHALGLAMELFKTAAGSWAYPEFAYSKVAGAVPLYSGFMYASVASYLCQAWRRLDVHLEGEPPAVASVPLAAAIYANFFTHHLGVPDLRWALAGLVAFTFRGTRAHYCVSGRAYCMPLAVAFVLVGLFVYLAENLTTFFGAWEYPHQAGGWQPVHLAKIGSWSLLVILSFILVAFLKQVKRTMPPAAGGAGKAQSRGERR